MNKQNTIEQIKKEEENAAHILAKAQNEVIREIEITKTKNEEKLANLKENLEDEIGKIFAQTDQEIAKIKQMITKEMAQEISEIKNIPEEKKIKAAEIIINKVKS